MTQRLSGANLTAVGQAHLEQRLLVYINLPSGSVNLCTGDTVFVDPDTSAEWTPVGGLGEIQEIGEDIDLQPNPVRLSLSGVDSAFVAEIMGEEFQNAAVEIKVGYLDPVTRQPVAAPVSVFSGFVSTASIEIGDRSASIVITAADEFELWSRADPWLYTDATQKDRWSGDRGLNQIVFMANRVLNWMGSTSKAGSGGISDASKFGAKRIG